MKRTITNEEAIKDLEELIQTLNEQIAESDEELKSWGDDMTPSQQRNKWRKSIAKKQQIIENLKKK